MHIEEVWSHLRNEICAYDLIIVPYLLYTIWNIAIYIYSARLSDI